MNLMDIFNNEDKPSPYNPGAGKKPPYLVDRNTIIVDTARSIYNISNKIVDNSILIYGVRGAGKTVLLNELSRFAEECHTKTDLIEISSNNTFTKALVEIASKWIYIK